MVQYIVMAFSVLSSIFVVAEKIFGGGNALAGKFHALDEKTTESITRMRRELDMAAADNGRVVNTGFEAMRSNIHALQLAQLEFRAKMAEEFHLYIRKDDYNAGIGEIKRDVQAGFTRVDARLGELQDLIMYRQEDPAPRSHPKPR